MSSVLQIFGNTAHIKMLMCQLHRRKSYGITDQLLYVQHFMDVYPIVVEIFYAKPQKL